MMGMDEIAMLTLMVGNRKTFVKMAWKIAQDIFSSVPKEQFDSLPKHKY